MTNPALTFEAQLTQGDVTYNESVHVNPHEYVAVGSMNGSKGILKPQELRNAVYFDKDLTWVSTNFPEGRYHMMAFTGLPLEHIALRSIMHDEQQFTHLGSELIAQVGNEGITIGTNENWYFRWVRSGFGQVGTYGDQPFSTTKDTLTLEGYGKEGEVVELAMRFVPYGTAEAYVPTFENGEEYLNGRGLRIDPKEFISIYGNPIDVIFPPHTKGVLHKPVVIITEMGRVIYSPNKNKLAALEFDNLAILTEKAKATMGIDALRKLHKYERKMEKARYDLFG